MATITPGYTLTVGEEYDPVLINAIFAALTIGAIIGSEIAAATITGSNIAPATIEGSNIAAATIEGSNIAAATISGTNITADAIGASHIASNTISADHLMTDSVTSTKILAGAVTTDKLYAGAVTADKMTVTSLDAISANLGQVTSGIITASIVRTSANPGVNRVIMDDSGLRGYDTNLGLTFNIYTDGTPPIFSSGVINNCTIINSTMISNDFKTSSELPWVEMTDSGVAYRFMGGGDVYGAGIYCPASADAWVTATDYYVDDWVSHSSTLYICLSDHTSGTFATDLASGKWSAGATYGAGVAAYYGNPNRPILSVEEELTFADIRLINRSTNPTGACAIGDLIAKNGDIEICRTAGTASAAKWYTVGEKPQGDITLVAGKKLIFDGGAI